MSGFQRSNAIITFVNDGGVFKVGAREPYNFFRGTWSPLFCCLEPQYYFTADSDPGNVYHRALSHQPNVVYKIPFADCDWCYVSETGRCFKTRKKKHIRNVKTCVDGLNVALRNMRGHSTIA